LNIFEYQEYVYIQLQTSPLLTVMFSHYPPPPFFLGQFWNFQFHKLYCHINFIISISYHNTGRLVPVYNFKISEYGWTITSILSPGLITIEHLLNNLLRELRRGNTKWTIQRNWQHRDHKTKTNKTKTQHNMWWTPLYVSKHK
jgi:hypothetical protein